MQQPITSPPLQKVNLKIAIKIYQWPVSQSVQIVLVSSNITIKIYQWTIKSQMFAKRNFKDHHKNKDQWTNAAQWSLCTLTSGIIEILLYAYCLSGYSIPSYCNTSRTRGKYQTQIYKGKGKGGYLQSRYLQRLIRLYINYPQVLKLNLSQSSPQGEYSQSHCLVLFHQVPISAGWTKRCGFKACTRLLHMTSMYF